ncbi:envelope integrity protein Cei [Sciscionella marina]|uniref:envelope integrity protein Cei n=1 Tax=Sciscionella marina TaxID=508770 RepID=UPI000373C4B1|nr:envelope integrity protein Cei [Sciscionella marina]
MAASSTVRRSGGQGKPRGRRPGYRRRRPLPAISILVLLGIVAIVVWVTAVTSSGDKGEVADCTVPKGIGTPLAPTELDKVQPTPPGQVTVQVLNASSQRGQANMVGTILEQLGFPQGAKPTNDPAYQSSSLDCHGQIRFGPAGQNAARTLSLVDPCAQLVRDDRKDAGVNFVIGQKFDDLRPSEAGRKVLDQLKAAGNGDGTVDPGLIKKARDTSNCG